MSQHLDPRRLSRRALLLGGAGAVTAYALRDAQAPGRRPGGAALPGLSDAQLTASNDAVPLHLAATDGWVSIADSAATPAIPPFWPDPLAAGHGTGLNLYVFGFRNVTGMTAAEISGVRGHAQISAPQLVFDEGTNVRITLTNLGLSQRPDLVDGHTIHWHGFVDAIPLFDGVPELSLSVPIGRDFTYFYRPHDAGTYMYHCHYEDVEHVQMGMTGMLFVRPKQNGSNVGGIDTGKHQLKYAYNDGDGSTQYDREFGFMMTEIWAEAHFRDAHIQTTDWTDYKPSFWALNGRTYPDTLGPNAPIPQASGAAVPGQTFSPVEAAKLAAASPSKYPARLTYQPTGSLVTCNAGDRVLLRLSNLGYQNHAMTVDGIELTVVAKDASLLKNGTTRNYLVTNTVDVGPGESRDVIFTAPDNPGPDPVRYLLYDRDYAYASNAGGAGRGGMATEIHVYPAGSLKAQQIPNDQFPA